MTGTKDQLKPERIFDFAVEGGGETLFRQMDDQGTLHFFENRSTMGMDENDVDMWRHSKRKHPSWESYWDRFSNRRHWIMFSPIFIHDDCKPAVLDSLVAYCLKETQKTTSPYHVQRNIRKWVQKLSCREEPQPTIKNALRIDMTRVKALPALTFFDLNVREIPSIQSLLDHIYLVGLATILPPHGYERYWFLINLQSAKRIDRSDISLANASIFPGDILQVRLSSSGLRRISRASRSRSRPRTSARQRNLRFEEAPTLDETDEAILNTVWDRLHERWQREDNPSESTPPHSRATDNDEDHDEDH